MTDPPFKDYDYRMLVGHEAVGRAPEGGSAWLSLDPEQWLEELQSQLERIEAAFEADRKDRISRIPRSGEVEEGWQEFEAQYRRTQDRRKARIDAYRQRIVEVRRLVSHVELERQTFMPAVVRAWLQLEAGNVEEAKETLAAVIAGGERQSFDGAVGRSRTGVPST